MRLRIFVVAIAAAVLLGLSATAAFADSCLNVSRAAPTSGGSGPITTGNWVWLPSIGVPVEAWGFAPPGGPESVAANAPGANGNYTDGRTESLLGMSATCTSGVNDSRQTDHGIQTGCL